MPDGDRLESLAFDPLTDSADPRCYVPIDTDERALDALVASLALHSSPTLLVGASGIGKTILLHVLAQRLRALGQHVLFSPFLHMPPEDAARWLLHLMSEPVEGDASTFLNAVTRRTRPTALLIDEIQCTPIESVRLLHRIAIAGQPAFSLVAAGTGGPALDALLPTLLPQKIVTLPDVLPDDEIDALCDAVLENRALPGALRERALRERDSLIRHAVGLPILLKAELDLCACDVAVGKLSPRSEPVPPAAPEAQPVQDAELLEAEPADLWPVAQAAEPSPAHDLLSAPHEDIDLGVWRGPPAPAVSERLRAHSAALATRARRATAVARSRCDAFAKRMRSGLAEAASWPVRSVALLTHRAGHRVATASVRARERGARVLLRLRAIAEKGRRVGPEHTAALATGARRATAVAWSRYGAFAKPRRPELAGAARAIGARTLQAARSPIRSVGLLTHHAGHRGAAAGVRALKRVPLQPVLLTATALVAFTLGVVLGPRALRDQPERLPAVSAGPPPHFELPSPATRMAAPAPQPGRVALETPAAGPARVRIHVNAQPWANVRVDGVDAGPTPLSHELVPGPHDFEASFPDGRIVRRRIEIGPNSRFVTLR